MRTVLPGTVGLPSNGSADWLLDTAMRKLYSTKKNAKYRKVRRVIYQQQRSKTAASVVVKNIPSE
jgi:hypothetical protein